MSPARILVVQHADRAPGGAFCRGLADRDAELVLVRPVEGEGLPASPDGFHGLVVLGGPQHAFEDRGSPHFQPLMALMRDFDRAGRPVAGICLGCQLLARAWGGRPGSLGFLEFGYVRHELTRAGRADALLGAEELPRLMEFHEDSFDLPPGAELLVRGDRCPNQCFRVGKGSYGFQFHIEADMATAASWVRLFREGEIETYRKHMAAFDENFLDGLERDLPDLASASERFCDGVAERWMALVQE